LAVVFFEAEAKIGSSLMPNLFHQVKLIHIPHTGGPRYMPGVARLFFFVYGPNLIQILYCGPQTFFWLVFCICFKKISRN